MFVGDLFLHFKDGREIRQINPSQTLMNLQYSNMPLSMFSIVCKHFQAVNMVNSGVFCYNSSRLLLLSQ